ncbi:MAG: zf-HC2 domain-containing protein [Acidobacteriota bacterium]|nr:zf-HC2 domain-containing protein [Acidobacteriota bacterium]
MNCKQARQTIVLDRYGELDPAEKARLEAHLLACAACAADRDETRAVLNLITEHRPAEVPAFDAEKSWRAVRDGIAAPARAGRTAAAPWRRFAPAAAGLAVVLAVGVLIGRFALKPGPGPDPGLTAGAGGASTAAPAPSAVAEYIRPMLASHIEDVRPLLLDFSHAINGAKPGALVSVDERLLRGLLLQNVLLRRALNGNDPAAAELLDDLDLVLKEIINGRYPGGASPAQVRDLIDERGILFRMQILKTI